MAYYAMMCVLCTECRDEQAIVNDHAGAGPLCSPCFEKLFKSARVASFYRDTHVGSRPRKFGELNAAAYETIDSVVLHMLTQERISFDELCERVDEYDALHGDGNVHSDNEIARDLVELIELGLVRVG